MNLKQSAVLTAGELGEILGVSEFTIKRLAREKQLPCTMMSRRYRFNLEEILEYFREVEGGAA
jgi:excisionase family DNA binding protein